MKSYVDNQVGYKVIGEVEVTLWGGDKGEIGIKPFEIHFQNENGELSDELIERIIRANVNDDGFGVQSIDYASVELRELYESGKTHHVEMLEFEATSEKPLGNWKENGNIVEENKNISLKIF